MANLTKSFQRGLDLCQLGSVASGLARELKLPLYFFPAPIVTLIYRHPAVIADLLHNGKHEEKDAAM